MPRILSLLISGLLLASCRPPAYVQPSENEPHAILKVRHVVHARRGPLYDSSVGIGRFAVDERTLEDTSSDASIIHLRVRPEAEMFAVAGTSYHMERRLVTRTRTVQEPYSCNQRTCSGYGTSQHCYTSYSTCYRSRQETYTEWQTVPVTDDACRMQFPLAPNAGSVYLLQFDYLGENQCNLSCFEQVSDSTGGFELVRCTPAVVQQTASR